MSPRSAKHGNQSGVSEEAAFEFGVLYSTIKNHAIAFAAKASNPYSFPDVATRLARLLESEALREQYLHPELVPEMWQDGTANRRGGRPPRGTDAVAGHLSEGAPRRRTLSAAARKRISKAQQARWAKVREDKGTKKKSRVGISSNGVKNFWAKMSPAQRSEEMRRRRKVAEQKAKKEGRHAFVRADSAENHPARANGAA